MAVQTTNTVVDITRRFEWELSQKQFEECGVGKILLSPDFSVEIERQVSKWRFGVYIRRGSDQNMETIKPDVLIFFGLLPGDVSQQVEVEGIGLKTERGYWPGKTFPQNLSWKEFSTKMISKIETFNGRKGRKDRVCVTYAGSKEGTLKLFDKNKITVVATARFYVDRQDYIKKIETEQNLLTHIRSIPELDTLADFTVICGGREFRCHRNILASRSTVFKGMILNDHFVENRQNSTTIDKASPDMVEAMLEFISKGKIPNDIEERAIDLIDLADRYDLQDLMDICASCLVNNLTVESVIETLIAIDLHIPDSLYRQKVLDFIKEEAAEVVKSNHWKKFMEKYPDLVIEIVLSLAKQAVRVADK